MNKRKIAETKGRRAEQIAKIWLILKGYRILAERYKAHVGEIDIIARRGKNIAFVEVKARGTLKEAKEAISYTSQKRIARAASQWMAQNKRHIKENVDYSLTFDLIAIVPNAFPRHMKDAWRPNV